MGWFLGVKAWKCARQNSSVLYWNSCLGVEWETNTMIIIFWNIDREQAISGETILIVKWSTLSPRCH